MYVNVVSRTTRSLDARHSTPGSLIFKRGRGTNIAGLQIEIKNQEFIEILFFFAESLRNIIGFISY
jgi:hypothetical protein